MSYSNVLNFFDILFFLKGALCRTRFRSLELEKSLEKYSFVLVWVSIGPIGYFRVYCVHLAFFLKLKGGYDIRFANHDGSSLLMPFNFG